MYPASNSTPDELQTGNQPHQFHKCLIYLLIFINKQIRGADLSPTAQLVQHDRPLDCIDSPSHVACDGQRSSLMHRAKGRPPLLLPRLPHVLLRECDIMGYAQGRLIRNVRAHQLRGLGILQLLFIPASESVPHICYSRSLRTSTCTYHPIDSRSLKFNECVQPIEPTMPLKAYLLASLIHTG